LVVSWIPCNTKLERYVANRQEDLPLSTLASRLLALPADDRAALIADVAGPLVADGSYKRYFDQWEDAGFHVTPNHFYEPIPDRHTLTDSLLERYHPMPGVDMREEHQIHLLTNIFPRFAAEYNTFPEYPVDALWRYSWHNDFFGVLDASIAYSFVRLLRPRRIVELGSGWSTLAIAEAVRLSESPVEYTVADPYPNAVVQAGVPGVTRLLTVPAERVELNIFRALDDGDILFIDTSHVVKTGGEVVYLFLEVLPQLKPGVMIHIHDIFLPKDYPSEWLRVRKQFWTEQYLLQAFLAFNSAFEVWFSVIDMVLKHLDLVDHTFPLYRSQWGGASFWIRRASA
jgi:hypothetical protein